MKQLHESAVYRIESPDSYSEAIADAKTKFAEAHDYTYQEVQAASFREQAGNFGANQPPGSIDVVVAPTNDVLDARFEQEMVNASTEEEAIVQARVNPKLFGEPKDDVRVLAEDEDGYVVGVEDS